MLTPRRAVNPQLRTELWLKSQAPRACTVAKLANNHLIFLSLLEELPANNESNHVDEISELLIFDGGADPLCIRARVTNHTRERWVLDPLERCLPLLPRLRNLLQQNPAGEQPTFNPPNHYRRSGLLDECRQVLREFITTRYALFYIRLDDALLLASASDKPHQQAYLDAVRTFERAHGEIEQDFKNRVDAMLSAASEPGFTPSEPSFRSAPGAGKVTGSALPSRAETALSRLASHATTQHQLALNHLSRRFSLLVRRLTEPASLPFGPSWLSWYFDQTLEKLELPTQARTIVYREFTDSVLGGIGTLAETLNDTFASFGLLPELESSTGLKAVLEHSDVLGSRADKPKNPGLGAQRILSGDLRPLFHSLDEFRRQLAQSGAEQTTATAPQAQAFRAVLADITADDRTAEEARPLLKLIEQAVFADATQDPTFFVEPSQAARRCLNLIAILCSDASFRGGPIKRQLPPICDRIQREHTRNTSIFQIVLPLLEELYERQRQTGERNKQRLADTQDGQHKLLAAQRVIDEQLYQSYADQPFATELQAFLDQGWYRYLVQLQLKYGSDSRELQQALAALHGLHGALHPTYAAVPAATLGSDQLTKAVTEPLECLGMASVHFHRAVFALRQAMDRVADSGAPRRESDQPTFSGRPRPGNHCRPLDKLPIEPGDWMGWLDNPVDEPMQLAWRAPDHSRYVFVDEAGQMLFELSGERLAHDMRHGLQRVPDPQSWPRLEETIYLAIQSSYAALNHRFRRDATTGLPDRDAFEAQLSDWIRFAGYSGQNHIIVGISISRKPAGQETDDSALTQRLAATMQSFYPEESDLAHLRSGLFAILLPYSDDEAARQFAASLHQSLHQLISNQAESHSFSSVQIDCLRLAPECTSAASLLTQLEARFKQVIADRDDVALASQDQQTRQRRLDWTSRLGRILDQNRLQLRCQAIVPVGAENTMHHEILLGIVGDDGLVSPPGELVAAAEQYDRMDIFDRWVIQHTFEWLRKHPARTRQLGCVHINLSSTALNSDRFLNFLLAELQPGDLPHQAMCFEISENAAIANLSKAADLIATVRNLSCHFALDNFGKSPRSLHLLRQLPVDIVKIDGSLTRQLPDQGFSTTLVEGIIQAAKVMGVRTVAECVENETILHHVDTLGIDFAQGYAVARPVLLDEI